MTGIHNRSIWERHKEDGRAQGVLQPSEKAEGFTGLMWCGDLCPVAGYSVMEWFEDDNIYIY